MTNILTLRLDDDSGISNEVQISEAVLPVASVGPAAVLLEAYNVLRASIDLRKRELDLH